ncbi:hypothetical protein [Ralstonia pseudosolanacearum]|uniref:hypothetical protein n=1 Tax=Ralstonia pseudosolanacearum TaxID=1310165 RepID=UPI002003233D|nr:hypothetical protein [Ralstonia pseudosolanacearum]MCK4154687.1 hypothetical protein [Ralstonia pseudosolanacearum]
MKMKDGPTFFWPLLAFSLFCAAMGGIDYFSKPTPTQELFKNTAYTVEIQGHVSVYDRSRGSKKIRIVGQRGESYFFDCLLYADLCDQTNPEEQLLSSTAVKISNDLYWPKTATFLHRRISAEESKLIYELYLERDAGFYKFWLALAAALAGFAFWFRNRPLLVE